MRGHFAALGLGAAFPTRSGHGLGLGHPEPPYLVPDSDETLIVGDVVALEPGLYVPGVGGMRFEQNYQSRITELRALARECHVTSVAVDETLFPGINPL